MIQLIKNLKNRQIKEYKTEIWLISCYQNFSLDGRDIIHLYFFVFISLNYYVINDRQGRNKRAKYCCITCFMNYISLNKNKPNDKFKQ